MSHSQSVSTGGSLPRKSLGSEPATPTGFATFPGLSSGASTPTNSDSTRHVSGGQSSVNAIEGWFFLEDFVVNLAVGIEQKIAQLDSINASDDSSGGVPDMSTGHPDSFLMQTLWEDYPRKCPFFVSSLRSWLALPRPMFEGLLAAVLAWAELPFSAQDKFPGISVRNNRLVEVLWSRCAGDVLNHLLRYDAAGGNEAAMSRDWTKLEELALAHCSLKPPAGSGREQVPRDIMSRIIAQAQVSWASLIGLAVKGKPSLITHIFNLRPSFLVWQFVDLTLTNSKVAREVLALLVDQLAQPKTEKASRLVMLLAFEPILERINFQPLLERDANWKSVFNDVVANRLFKLAEQLAKIEELKAAALSLMLTILIHAPRDFHESNYASFFSKRVLRHLSEPRKVTHSLEIILRSLRNHRFARPTTGFDAFENYVPMQTRFRMSHSAFTYVTTLNRRALESIYMEVFERSKSKALTSLSGSSSYNLANSAPPTVNTSSSPVNTIEVDTGNVGSLFMSGNRTSQSSVVSVASYGSTSSFSKAPSISHAQQHSMPALPKNLVVCKHILLQLAAHDLTIFRDKAFPSLLQLPDDLARCSSSAANRATVGIRALWDILGPGTSVFRETAFCLHHGQIDPNLAALKDILKASVRTITGMMSSLQHALGLEAMGQSEYPLVPTLLWDGCMGFSSSGDDTQSLHDPMGDHRGYPFAWADPTKSQSFDTYIFTSNGLVLELQHLLNTSDVFEGGNEVAFRARNLTDKYGAELQIAQTMRLRSAFFKKRSNPALDVFRELIYIFPLLSCSPVQGRPSSGEAPLPDVTLLLHADWFIATAMSHALQRIVGTAPDDNIRIRVLLKLAREIRGSVRRAPTCTRVVLTYLRQLTLLLRLWLHLRSCKTNEELNKMPELLDVGGEPLLTLSIALMCFPCTSVRMHAQEVIESIQQLWPQFKTACKRLTRVFCKHEPFSFQCALKASCGCAAVSSDTELHRRRTADDAQPLKVNHRSSPTASTSSPMNGQSLAHPTLHQQHLQPHHHHERSATADGNTRGSPLSADSLRHHIHSNQLPQTGSQTMPALGGNQIIPTLSTASTYSHGSMGEGAAPRIPVLRGAVPLDTLFKGSTAPLEGAYDYIALKEAPLVSRDELFMWYRATGVPVDGLDPRCGSGRSDQWADELVKITRELVEFPDLYELLHQSTVILLEWLNKLSAFHIDHDQIWFFEAVLRKSAVATVLGLSGTSKELDRSPLKIEPDSVDWPGEMENDTENLLHDLWDAAIRIRPTSQEQIALRRIVIDIIGRSFHPKCVSRAISLCLSWRQTRLTTGSGLARATVNEERPKFGKFRRNRANDNSTPQHIDGDPGTVEQVCCSSLRILLTSATRHAQLPGWEQALRMVFDYMSHVAQSERLRSSEWTVTQEFVKLALQSAKTLRSSFPSEIEMPQVVQRADQVWLRAERRRIWKLMQSIVGFDDVKIFAVQSVSNPPRTSLDGSTPTSNSHNRSGATDVNVSGRSFAQGDRQPISEANFRMIRELATQVGAQMLCLGPTSLGTVAPRPDEMLWAWFYYDEECTKSLKLIAPLLRNYLVAHWHVGDVEAAGGGTFGPYIERWFEEIQKQSLGQSHADAIFAAFSDAINAWLFRGSEHAMVRPLEPSAITLLAFAALVLASSHERPGFRSRAFGILDVVERSDSWARLETGNARGSALPYELHSASTLGQQTWASDSKTIEQAAEQASIILADRCSGIGASLLSHLCQRLPALYKAKLMRHAIQVCIAFAQSPSTRVCGTTSTFTAPQDPDFVPETPPHLVRTRKSRSNSARGSQRGGAEVDDIRVQVPHDSHGSRRAAHGTMELQMRQSVQKDMRRAQKSYFNLEEIWTAILDVLKVVENEKRAMGSTKVLVWDGRDALDMLLPLWRALCQNHATTVVDFLLAHILESSSPQGLPVHREIASFFLTAIAPEVFAASPNIILNNLVLGVLYRVNLSDVVRGLFAGPTSSPSSQRPRILQEWIQLALTQNADPIGHLSHNPEREQNLMTLLQSQRCVLQALNQCATGNRKLCAMAFPQMLTFSLCSIVGLNQRTPRTSTRDTRGAASACITQLLHALIHERLIRKHSRDAAADPMLAVTLPAHLTGPSTERLLVLAEASPLEYTKQELSEVVSAMVELLTICAPDGDLLHLWCQCLLLNALGLYQQQMLWKPSLMERCLSVYAILRTKISGPLYLVRGFAEVDEAVASWIEILGILRMSHQAMYNKSPDLLERTLFCISQLTAVQISPTLCKFILNIYATNAQNKQIEKLCQKLLLHSLPETLDEENVCIDALEMKLQDQITSELVLFEEQDEVFGNSEMETDDEDPNDLLSLSARLFCCGLLRMELLCVLLPIVTMGGLARGVLIEETISKLNLPAEIQDSLRAIILRPTDEQLLQSTCVALMDYKGAELFALGFTTACLRQIKRTTCTSHSDTYLTAVLRIVTCMLRTAPATYVSLLLLIRMGTAVEIASKPKAMRKVVRELLQVAHDASILCLKPEDSASRVVPSSSVSSAQSDTTGSLPAAPPFHSEGFSTRNLTLSLDMYREDALANMAALIESDASALEELLSQFMLRPGSPVGGATVQWRRTSDSGFRGTRRASLESGLALELQGVEEMKLGSNIHQPPTIETHSRAASPVLTSPNYTGRDSSDANFDEYTIGGVASFDRSKHLNSRRDMSENSLDNFAHIHESEDKEDEGDLSDSSDEIHQDTGISGWTASSYRPGRTPGTIRLMRYKTLDRGGVSEQQSAVMRRSFLEELLADRSNHKQIETFIVQQPSIDTSWLEFALAVIDFKKKPSKDLAESVNKQFIVLDGLDTIDVPDELRDCVESAILEDRVSSDLFDEGFRLALDYLDKNFLGRYLRSSQYCEA